MNILYISSDIGLPVLGRKGAAVRMRSLVSAFAAAGHAVVIAAPVLNGSPWEAPASVNVDVMHVPVPDDAVAAADAVRAYNQSLGISNPVPSELRRILYNRQLETALVRRFEHAPPDFIYERAAAFATAGAATAHALGVRFVVELSTPLSLELPKNRGATLAGLAVDAERRILREADIVLTVSNALRQHVISLGIPPARVQVTPNGVDPRVFTPGERCVRTRARWGIGPGPVLGFVGGLRPWHGVRALPPLLERLSADHPGVQMIIVGDGPLRGEIEAAFQAKGLADRVVFTGGAAHDQMATLVRLFDVAVAPYNESEHLFYFSPLKLFEYMACGVPVVAAAIGQIAEVVRDEEDGLLYTPGDMDGLVRACTRLLDDAAFRERIGRAGAALVRQRFTWDDNAARVITAVRSLSSGSGARI